MCIKIWIQIKKFKFRTKAKIVKIGLQIFFLPSNTSLRIQNLQFTSVPSLYTSRKQFDNFTHAILWSMSNTPFYKARQTRHFLKHTKHVIFIKHAKHAKLIEHTSTSSTRARKACEHAKQVSTPVRHLADSFCKHVLVL